MCRYGTLPIVCSPATHTHRRHVSVAEQLSRLEYACLALLEAEAQAIGYCSFLPGTRPAVCLMTCLLTCGHLAVTCHAALTSLPVCYVTVDYGCVSVGSTPSPDIREAQLVASKPWALAMSSQATFWAATGFGATPLCWPGKPSSLPAFPNVNATRQS